MPSDCPHSSARRVFLQGLACLAGNVWLGAPSWAGGLRVGAPAPAATLVTLDGQRISSADLLGQVVVLALPRRAAAAFRLSRETCRRRTADTRFRPRHARQTRRCPAGGTLSAFPRGSHERLERTGLRPYLASASQLHHRSRRAPRRGWLEREAAGVDTRTSRPGRDPAAHRWLKVRHGGGARPPPE